MALIECIGCDKAISVQEQSCPHCGMVLPKANTPPTLPQTQARARAITLMLIGISAVVYALTVTNPKWIQVFSITQYKGMGYKVDWESALPEITSGQLWRLFTPSLIHFSIISFFPGMAFLFYFGSRIEKRNGPRFLVIFVLLAGILSNLGQYAWNGPNFGGSGGVVYALFGYAWMVGMSSRGNDAKLPTYIVVIFLLLLALEFIPLGPGHRSAYVVTGVGFAFGLAWGCLSAFGGNGSKQLANN